MYNNTEFENIINFADVKNGDIYINLIHYDKNIKNKENFNYYRYFSIKIMGIYLPFDDFDILQLFLSTHKQIPNPPPFILLTSGSEAEIILKAFHNFSFITHIIIFCFKKDKFFYLTKFYNKLELITKKFGDVIKYLKTKKFSERDLDIDNHLLLTPLITYYDYKKILFPIHRILAYFFEIEPDELSYEYFEIAKKFIDKSTVDEGTKKKIINIIEKLVNCENFPEKCIKYYTSENLCYVFNKALRNFEKFYVEMAHFIGPFYYGIFKYSLNHPEKLLHKKTILYRDITMNRLDLYFYQFSEKDIICFPSFTSTTLYENLNFKPTKNANKINKNIQIEEKGYVKMIITYDPKEDSFPQGLNISDKSLTFHSKEKEFLLFPFTFLKIDKVEINSGKKDDKHIIYLTIINKSDILEFGLIKKFAFKLVDNGTSIAIDYDNDSTCDNNELFYKIDLDSKYIKKSLLDKDNNKEKNIINEKKEEHSSYEIFQMKDKMKRMLAETKNKEEI